VDRGLSVRSRQPAATLLLALAALFALVVGVGGAASAATPEETAKARDHFRRAKTHFELKEYKEALDEFKNAYRYVQDPVLLVNIGQCHYKLEQYDEALSFYKNYLRRAPQASNRAEVEGKVAELEQLIAERHKTSPPAVSPGPASGPRVEPPPTSPGPAASAPSGNGARPPSPGGSSGSSGGASPVLLPPPVVTPVDAPAVGLSTGADPGAPPPVYKRWWFWTGVGVAVAAGVVTAVAMSKRGEVGQCAPMLPCVKVPE
jgi:hypothetical protein